MGGVYAKSKSYEKSFSSVINYLKSKIIACKNVPVSALQLINLFSSFLVLTLYNGCFGRDSKFFHINFLLQRSGANLLVIILVLLVTSDSIAVGMMFELWVRNQK